MAFDHSVGVNWGEVDVLHWTPGVGLGEAHILRPSVAGMPPGQTQDNQWFGFALATGDFDGDHFADLAIGIPHRSVFAGPTQVGAETILYGSMFSDGFEVGAPELVRGQRDGERIASAVHAAPPFPADRRKSSPSSSSACAKAPMPSFRLRRGREKRPECRRRWRRQESPATGQILVLEPRRIAARAAARRIAEEQGWTLGREVGWQIRFERNFTRETRILFVTEGILVQRLQRDPFLDGIGAVLFDEFHERSLFADLSLALVRRVQREARPELKLLPMSATLDGELLAKYLEAPIVTSAGRLFPISIEYLDTPAVEVPPRDPRRARRSSGTRGDFRRPARLPSGRTGDPACRRGARNARPGARPRRRPPLRRSAFERAGSRSPTRNATQGRPGDQRRRDLDHRRWRHRRGRLGLGEGERRRSGDRTRAPVARPDLAGVCRAAVRSRRTPGPRLVPAAVERARAARTSGARPARDPPRRSRLDRPAARSLGRARPRRGFPGSKRRKRTLSPAASSSLGRLGALDDDGITALGRSLADFPLHPRLALLVLEGERRGVAEDAALVAALLSDRDPTSTAELAPRRRPH